MRIETFEAILKKVGVPTHEYCVDPAVLHRKYEAFALERKGPIWCVYYYERGRKSSYRFFFSQSSALRYMLAMLLEDYYTRYDRGSRT